MALAQADGRFRPSIHLKAGHRFQQGGAERLWLRFQQGNLAPEPGLAELRQGLITKPAARCQRFLQGMKGRHQARRLARLSASTHKRLARLEHNAWKRE